MDSPANYEYSGLNSPADNGHVGLDSPTGNGHDGLTYQPIDGHGGLTHQPTNGHGGLNHQPINEHVGIDPTANNIDIDKEFMDLFYLIIQLCVLITNTELPPQVCRYEIRWEKPLTTRTWSKINMRTPF